MARKKGKSTEVKRKNAASQTTLPERINPMLAQSLAEPFDSPDHLFEIKWDGTRCIAFVERERIRLQNRRHMEMRLRYPELAGLSVFPAGTVLDGEIVVLEDGKPSFTKLQQRDHLLDPRKIQILSERLPATYVVFDLLFSKGRSVMDQPLEFRRRELEKLLSDHDHPHVILSDGIAENGRAYFAGVESLGLEGVMAKKIDSPYLPGKRSPYWIKVKVARVEVFVILGFVPRKDELSIKALSLGTWYRDRWIFKGNVGTGFTESQRADWYKRLNSASPLEKPPADGPRDAVWKDTGVNCRVRFFEKTVAGRLRGPVFVGIVE